jgi:hypothetical protein
MVVTRKASFLRDFSLQFCCLSWLCFASSLLNVYVTVVTIFIDQVGNISVRVFVLFVCSDGLSYMR